jgi:hypothetical protein
MFFKLIPECYHSRGGLRAGPPGSCWYNREFKLLIPQLPGPVVRVLYWQVCWISIRPGP